MVLKHLIVSIENQNNGYHKVYFMITTFDYYQNYSHNVFIKTS